LFVFVVYIADCKKKNRKTQKIKKIESTKDACELKLEELDSLRSLKENDFNEIYNCAKSLMEKNQLGHCNFVLT
jgi:hypothetical protein